MDAEQLQALFTYHSPTDEQIDKYRDIRTQAFDLACEINALCPESREKSLAITHLQSAVMFANASIALENPPK